MHTLRLWYFIPLLLLLITTCLQQNTIPISNIVEVSGEGVLTRNGESKRIEPGMNLKKKDVVILSDRSKAKVLMHDGSIVYLLPETNIAFNGQENSSDSFSSVILTLQNGTIFLSKVNSESLKYQIRTINGSAMVSGGDVVFSMDSKAKKITVSALNDSVTISYNSSTVLLSSCTQMEFSNGACGQIEPISESKILELKQWVSSSVVMTALSKSDCIAKAPVAQKMAPEWIKLPKEICAVGQLFLDTVYAADLGNGSVNYGVYSSPPGMEIDSKKGIIRYFSAIAGQFKITLYASNQDSMISVFDYTLTVTNGLGVMISSPRFVAINKRVTISANVLQNKGTRGGLFYRFDYDGDGKFDFPLGGGFGKIKSNDFTYTKEGAFTIKVEIQDKDKNIATSSRLITVKAPPRASFVVYPSVCKVGAEVLLDASGCTDSRQSPDSLLVRFDINGDGKWDIPTGGGFLNEKKVVWAYQDPGKIKLRLEVMSSCGLTDTAYAELEIRSGVNITSIVAPDTVHIGDSVMMECLVSESEFPITKFEWNMDNDTVFEQSSTSKKFKYRFAKEGVARISCRITDEKGQSDVKQKTVIVINSKAIVNAGGPYTTKINAPLTLKGTAKDADSKFISYAWDLNGDGVMDSIYTENHAITAVFAKSGKKKIYFVATTDDKAVWKDSAIVNVLNVKPVAFAGEDIVSSAGRKVRLNGIGTDEDQNIIKYEWDFDNDGISDYSSNQNGITSHVFEKYSKAVLKVTDSDGAFSTDTISIVICPDDMKTIENGKFCIDTYEYPDKKDQVPLINVSYAEAHKMCLDQGKHLCTAAEWEAACTGGRKDLSYPYGKSFEKDQCNTIGNGFVKNKVAVSGEFSKCTSPAGVVDMSGNVAELVDAPSGYSYIYGGSYQTGKDESKCNSIVQLERSRKYFYVGFRCCK